MDPAKCIYITAKAWIAIIMSMELEASAVIIDDLSAYRRYFSLL